MVADLSPFESLSLPREAAAVLRAALAGTPGDLLLDPALVRELLATAPRPLVQIAAELLFLDGQYVFHQRTDTGGETFVWLHPQDVAEAFAGDERIDSGWLPPHVLRYGKGPRGTYVVQWMPPGQQVLRFQLPHGRLPGQRRRRRHEFDLVQVPLPPLIWAGCGPRWQCWAITDPVPRPTSVLYQPPLGNVYPSGDICWGANEPDPCSVSTVEATWRLFIESPFTDHLHTRKSHQYPEDFRLQLEALASLEATTYPLDDLVPCTPSLTLTDAVTRLLGNESA